VGSYFIQWSGLIYLIVGIIIIDIIDMPCMGRKVNMSVKQKQKKQNLFFYLVACFAQLWEGATLPEISGALT
jgi:hypothetical protein